ncbi:aminotransferase class V-fold PLP-dependent enzyme [Sinorhizobium terangae]|uniref:aminotransferase class V-fold PLP-dependent enzyme n=1 Tax=Sinorhizobium terangae TaxID=110322 RepID=UPI0024B19F7B|nr:aminotransferase class V-fold PLP-dependent enzyme [Sinorhizobium terangae]WFU51754.1 aminotransferase class V-fold PLP-dependent enzyme [Sinorhizobium terangae]
MSIYEVESASGIAPVRALIEEWGIEPLVNCGGVRTRYGGSRTLPEAIAEMETIQNQFVDMDELNVAAGSAMSRLLDVEWGLVTGGASAAITLATAAAIAGRDPFIAMSMPFHCLERSIVALPNGHLSPYDMAITGAGGILVEIGDIDELFAVRDKIALMFFVGLREADGAITFSAWLEAAARFDVPVLVDAASEFLIGPERWTQRGAGLVAYSGAKRIGGPSGAGLLLGRRDLVKAATLHTAPNFGIGRSMKVSREEVVGMLRAVELNAKNGCMLWQPDRELECRGMLESIRLGLCSIEGVRAEVVEGTPALPIPRLRIEWAPSAITRSGPSILAALRDGRPAIVVEEQWVAEHSITIDAFCMQRGEEDVVLRRLVEELESPQKVQVEPISRGNNLRRSESCWTLATYFNSSPRTGRLVFSQGDGPVRGEYVDDDLIAEVQGFRRGAVLNFFLNTEKFGNQIVINFVGAVHGDKATGTATFGRMLPQKNAFLPDLNRDKIRWTAEKLNPAGQDRGL